jgi:hypothetical protein
MPGGYGNQTWPDQWLPGVRARLVDKVRSLTKDRAFMSMQGEEFHLNFPVADQFITLFTPDFPVDQNMVTGGGNINTAFDSTLETTVFCRVESDVEGRSVEQLEEYAIGVYQFIQQVMTALQDWQGPTADDGRQMFRRPMRTRPGFRINRKPGMNNKRWAVAPISWECSFVGNLGNNWPGG